MEKEKMVTINRAWFTGLCKVVDNLAEEIDNDANIDAHGWISHLIGYVHSLDEYFKD